MKISRFLTRSFLCGAFAMLFVSLPRAFAQNASQNVTDMNGNGSYGTLYWTGSTINARCGYGGGFGTFPLTIYVDKDFTFVPTGGSSVPPSTPGEADYTNSGGAVGCPAQGPSPATLVLTFSEAGVTYTVYFDINYEGGGTAQLYSRT